MSGRRGEGWHSVRAGLVEGTREAHAATRLCNASRHHENVDTYGYSFPSECVTSAASQGRPATAAEQGVQHPATRRQPGAGWARVRSWRVGGAGRGFGRHSIGRDHRTALSGHLAHLVPSPLRPLLRVGNNVPTGHSLAPTDQSRPRPGWARLDDAGLDGEVSHDQLTRSITSRTE